MRTVPYEILERAWNNYILHLRQDEYLQRWLQTMRSKDDHPVTYCSVDIGNIALVTAMMTVIRGKQLEVTVLHDSYGCNPNATFFSSSSLTRNLPQDIQRMIRGEE